MPSLHPNQPLQGRDSGKARTGHAGREPSGPDHRPPYIHLNNGTIGQGKQLLREPMAASSWQGMAPGITPFHRAPYLWLVEPGPRGQK